MDAISLDQQYQQSIGNFSECVRHESWTRLQLEEFQAQALRACREYAYTHSSFYRHFHQGLMDSPLQELPVLTKPLMMEHFDELVTDPAIRLNDVKEYLAHGDRTKPFLNRYMSSGTSGSTGERGVLLYDRAEGPAMKNSFNRAVLWGGITEEDRVALVTTTDPSQLTTQVPIILNENMCSDYNCPLTIRWSPSSSVSTSISQTRWCCIPRLPLFWLMSSARDVCASPPA